MTSNLSDARHLAARIAGRAELLDLRAVRFAAELHDASVDPPYDLKVEMTPSFELQGVGDEGDLWLAIFSIGYDLNLTSEGFTAALMRCTYNAVYELRLSPAPSDEELRAFGDTTVTLALYPYLRQFAHDASARLNLPPVVMPIYREPIRLEDETGVSPQRKELSARKAAAKKPTGKAQPEAPAKKARPRKRPAARSK